VPPARTADRLRSPEWTRSTVQSQPAPPQLVPGDLPCWVVLDHVRVPGNPGTLIRTSAAVGAAGFILLGGSADPFDAVVVRASMGACVGRALRAGIGKLQTWTRQHDLLVVGASPDGSVPCDELGYARPTVLILSEECGGLTAEQRALC
jgi:TrmH family RNA methyltransferase